MLSVLISGAGLEKDYAAWREAFWKAVTNGLKQDETSTKKHKACKHPRDDKCYCIMSSITGRLYCYPTSDFYTCIIS